MAERAYCPNHGMQDVVETETTDSGDRYAVVEDYFIQRLACGDTATAITGVAPSTLGAGDGALARSYDLPDAMDEGW